VRALLHTDASVERMFLNDEFDVWAVGEDLVAKFPRTEIDAAKVPVEEALHPTLRRLLGDVVPEIRLIGSMGDTDRRFIVHKRANGRQGQTIDGVTISPADGLARHLGTLFRTLHEVDVRGVCELGIGERHLSFDLPPLSEETIATTTGPRLNIVPPASNSIRQPTQRHAQLRAATNCQRKEERLAI